MEDEEKTNGLQKILLFFGERLAIIFFAVFVFILLVSGNATQALSKQKDPAFIPQQNNWYQDNVSFPVEKSQDKNSSYTIASAEITPTPTPIIDVSLNDIWEKLAQCETHGNWSSDTRNGYYGGLQFSMSAWISTGGTGNPKDASKDEQITRGKILQAARGWEPWGGCSHKLGLL
ncbi:MAG: transglycosylase family protein [Candidatus Levyibacteriota bacterium]